MRAAAGWHRMKSALHFGRAVNHWSSAVRVYDFHQRARGTYFTVVYPLFCTYLRRETQTKLSLGSIDRGPAENSFTGTWWYSKAGSQSHISECHGMEGWAGDVHLDRDFCTALPRFLLVLISGSLQANGNLWWRCQGAGRAGCSYRKGTVAH